MRRTMNVKGFLVLLGVVLAVFLILFLVLRGQRGAVVSREDALRLKLVEMEEENRILTERMSEVGTQNYIVSNALDVYSYMLKDDIRFEFTNPEALNAYTPEEWQILTEEWQSMSADGVL